VGKANKDIFYLAERRAALELLETAYEIDANLPDLEYEIRKRLLSKERLTGIYFLLNNENKLLYVGKSANVEKRLVDHAEGKGGNSHRFLGSVDKIKIVFFEPMKTKELSELEKIFIKTLRPAFNGSCDSLSKSTVKSYGYHSLYFDLLEDYGRIRHDDTRGCIAANKLLVSWEALPIE
jgi:predicted GIY-YIG superfamily endonuclease